MSSKIAKIDKINVINVTVGSKGGGCINTGLVYTYLYDLKLYFS